MTAKVTHRRESTVETFLLHRHRMFLISLIASRISFRLICLMNTVFIILVDHLSRTRLIASLGIAVLSCCLWAFEDREVIFRIRTLEEMMARRSGGEEEDFYIQSLYRPSKYIRVESFIRLEPLFWYVFMAALILLRFFIEKSPG